MIFARSPVPGRVKTRLTTMLGEDNAAQLYAAMLQDVLTMSTVAIQQASDGEVVVVYTPDDAFEPVPYSLADYWDGSRQPQNGADLGARMLNAMQAGFAAGARHIVLIGSDSPDLPPQLVGAAFAQLRETPLVFGPSKDGGFYLVGATPTLPAEIFDDVTWSAETTLEQVLANAARLQSTTSLLEMWHDVDTKADLVQLVQRLEFNAESSIAPATRQWLQNNRDAIKTASAASPLHRDG